MSGRLSSVALAAGIVLTSATQLRPAGLPLGAGEAVLAAWAAFTLAKWWADRTERPAMTGSLAALCVFWLLSMVTAASGSLLALWFREFHPAGAQHDFAALGFAAAISILVAGEMQKDGVAASTARWLVIFTALVGSGLLILAVTAGSVGPVELWYAALRFRGWAENPNQLALLFVGTPFLAAALAALDRRNSGRWMLAAVVVVVAGVATLSDAMILAWTAVAAALLALAWLRQLFTANSSSASLLGYGFLLPIGVLAMALLFAESISEAAGWFAESTYEEGGQGVTRFNLWSHSLAAFAESPVFGWGPGPHGGYEAPHSGVEAHNIFIDWATSTGVIGLSLLVGLLAFAGVALVRSRQVHLSATAGALILFGVFHYILRQPLFWIYLIVVVELARTCSPTTAARTGELPCVAS